MADEAVREMYDTLMEAIAEIDTNLDSLDDSGSAGKRKISNDLIVANQENVDKVTGQLIPQLRNLDADTLAGVFRGIVQGLTKEFGEEVSKTIEEKVEAAPKVEPLVTEEEAKELSGQRSELYKSVKQVVNLAEVMYQLELTMPKIRRGSKGKRGPRIVTQMNWSIDGEMLDEEIKYKEVAIACGFEGSAKLTAFLREQEVDTKAPANNEIRVNLPDGRELYGFVPEEDDDDEDDDED